MTYLTENADRSGPRSGIDLAALDRTDRILLGSCAAVWLAALGVGVAATVALVDFSRGHTVSSSDTGTPWILYSVIGVSAVVILAAVPLLLRARRAAQGAPDPQSRSQGPVPKTEVAAPKPQLAPAPGAEAPTEKFKAVVPAAEPAPSDSPVRERPQVDAGEADLAAIDQLWLRCAAGIGCAAGVATLLTAMSTYLVAVGSDTAAWVLYGIAGAVTLGMAAIPWYVLRELRTLIDRQ